MNFRVVPDPMIKLSLLEDAMRFEAAGSDPLVESADAGSSAAESAASTSATGERGTRSAVRGNITLDPLPPTNLPRRLPQPLPCITEVVTPSGKKPIMKAMLTTACERNCNYCVFRAGRSKTQRITFTPDEMAKANDLVARAGLAQGIFLSSGIIKGGVTTQDRLIDTAEIIRHKYGYRDYLHLKIMPGAEYDQIRRAMQLADRVSVNLEGATEQRLAFLAPKKNYWDELMTRIRWMAQLKWAPRARAMSSSSPPASGSTATSGCGAPTTCPSVRWSRPPSRGCLPPRARGNFASTRPAFSCAITGGRWRISPSSPVAACHWTPTPSWPGRSRICSLRWR
jgi:hypothetical protein